MISFLSEHIIRVFMKNDIIENEKSEIYQYGFEILVSSVITFMITVLTGLILNCLLASLLYFFIFAVMRQICGGYHAKHYWSCNLLFAIVTLFVLSVFKYFPINVFAIGHYIFLAVSILVIFVYAPIENKNKPLSKYQKGLFKIVSRIAVTLLAVISCLFYIIHSPYAKLIDITMFSIAISILAVGIKERGDSNEKE